jgi:hypothetical protein
MRHPGSVAATPFIRPPSVRILAVLCLPLILIGCATTPIDRDQPLRLGANKGVVALMTDTLDPLMEIDIEPNFSGGSKLTIPALAAGRDIYVFVATAGNYCFAGFTFGNLRFSRTDKRAGCFDVRAGRMNPGITIAPRVVNGVANYGSDAVDRDACTALLRQRFPAIARQFGACGGK